MNKQDKENLDDLLQDRFKNFGEVPSPDVWRRIEPNLPGRNIWPILFYCMAFLVGLSAGIVGYSKFTTQPPIINNEIAKTDKKNTKIKEVINASKNQKSLNTKDSITIDFLTKMISKLEGKLNSVENKVEKQNRLLDQLNKTITYQNSVINNYYSSNNSILKLLSSDLKNPNTLITNIPGKTNAETLEKRLKGITEHSATIPSSLPDKETEISKSPIASTKNEESKSLVSLTEEFYSTIDFNKVITDTVNKLNNAIIPGHPKSNDSSSALLTSPGKNNLLIIKDSISKEQIIKKDSISPIVVSSNEKEKKANEQEKFHRWESEIAGGIGYTFRSISLADTRLDTFYYERKKSETGKLKGWSGIFITYKIRPYLGLKTGILYSTLGEQFKILKYSNVANSTSTYQPSYSTQELSYNLSTNKNYIGIPVMAQLSFALSQKLSLDLSGGICFQKLINGTSIINIPNDYVKIDWKQNNKNTYKKYTQSFISQIKFVFEMSSTIGIFAGYQGNYFLNSISQGEGCIEERPYSNSLLIGVKYKF